MSAYDYGDVCDMDISDSEDSPGPMMPSDPGGSPPPLPTGPPPRLSQPPPPPVQEVTARQGGTPGTGTGNFSKPAGWSDLPKELMKLGWRKLWSKQKQRPYFFNKKTKKATWKMPEIPQKDSSAISSLIDAYGSSDEEEEEGRQSKRKGKVAAPPEMLRLVVLQSTAVRSGTLFTTGRANANIGRLNQPITIQEVAVSKVHSEIQYNEKTHQFMVRDVGSMNGTFLNGTRLAQPKKVSGPFPISHGDELKVGNTVMQAHVHPGNDSCFDCRQLTDVLLGSRKEEMVRERPRMEYGVQEYGAAPPTWEAASVQGYRGNAGEEDPAESLKRQVQQALDALKAPPEVPPSAPTFEPQQASSAPDISSVLGLLKSTGTPSDQGSSLHQSIQHVLDAAKFVPSEVPPSEDVLQLQQEAQPQAHHVAPSVLPAAESDPLKQAVLQALNAGSKNAPAEPPADQNASLQQGSHLQTPTAGKSSDLPRPLLEDTFLQDSIRKALQAIQSVPGLLPQVLPPGIGQGKDSPITQVEQYSQLQPEQSPQTLEHEQRVVQPEMQHVFLKEDTAQELTHSKPSPTQQPLLKKETKPAKVVQSPPAPSNKDMPLQQPLLYEVETTSKSGLPPVSKDMLVEQQSLIVEAVSKTVPQVSQPSAPPTKQPRSILKQSAQPTADQDIFPSQPKKENTSKLPPPATQPVPSEPPSHKEEKTVQQPAPTSTASSSLKSALVTRVDSAPKVQPVLLKTSIAPKVKPATSNIDGPPEVKPAPPTDAPPPPLPKVNAAPEVELPPLPPTDQDDRVKPAPPAAQPAPDADFPPLPPCDQDLRVRPPPLPPPSSAAPPLPPTSSAPPQQTPYPSWTSDTPATSTAQPPAPPPAPPFDITKPPPPPPPPPSDEPQPPPPPADTAPQPPPPPVSTATTSAMYQPYYDPGTGMYSQAYMQQYPPPSMGSGGYDWAAAAQWYSQAMAYSQGYMQNMDTTSWAGTGWQDNSSNANWQMGMSQENKEGMAGNNQMGGPPDNQMTPGNQMGGPTNDQMGGPPGNQMGGPQDNQVGGPQDNQMGGPPGNQMGRQPGNQMGGPPSNQMGRQPGNQMGGPPSNQMGGPHGNQMGGPPGNQMGGLPGNQMGGAPGNHMGGPPGNQMGGPPGNQMGGPHGNQMGGPPGNQMGGPHGNQMGRQSGNQMGGPPGNQMGGPPGNQMGGPPGNQMGGPPGNQMGGPPSNQMGGPPSNQMGRPQGNQMGGPPGNQMGMFGNNQMGMQQNAGPGNNWQNRGRPSDRAGTGGFQDSMEESWTDGDGPWQRNQGGRRPGQEKGPKRGILKRKSQHDDSTVSANETPLGPPPAKLAGRFGRSEPGAQPEPFQPRPPDTGPAALETFGSVQPGPSADNMDQMWNDFDNEVTVLEEQLIAKGIKKKPGGDKQDEPNLPDTRELVIQSLVQMGMPTPTEEAIQNVLQNSALVKQIQQIYIASTAAAAAAGKDAATPPQEPPPPPVQASVEEREAAIELLMKLKQPITDESIEKILQDPEVMQYIKLQVEKKRALEEAKQAVAAKQGASLVDVDYRRRPAHEEEYRRTPPIPSERPGDYRRMAPGMRPEDPGYGYDDHYGRMRQHEGYLKDWGRGRPPPPRGREGNMGLRDEFPEEKAEKLEDKAPGSRRGSFFKPVEGTKRDTVGALYNIDKEKVKGFSTKLLEALKGAREKLGEGKEEKDDHFSKQLTVAFTDSKLQEEMQSLFHSCHQSQQPLLASQDSKEQSQDANGDSLQSTQVSSTSEQGANSQGNLGITQQAIVAFTQALTPHLNLRELLTGQVSQDDSTAQESDTKEGEEQKEKPETGDSQEEDNKKETSEGESSGQTEGLDKAKEDSSNENKDTQDSTGDSEKQSKSTDTAISEAAVQSFTYKLIEQLSVLNKELGSTASEDLVKPGPSGEGHRAGHEGRFPPERDPYYQDRWYAPGHERVGRRDPEWEAYYRDNYYREQYYRERELYYRERGARYSELDRPSYSELDRPYGRERAHAREWEEYERRRALVRRGNPLLDRRNEDHSRSMSPAAGRASGSPALGQRSLSKSPVRELQRRLGGEETRGSLTFEVFEYITEFDKVGKEGDRRRQDDKDRRSEERRSKERSDSRGQDKGRSPSSEKSKSPKEDDKDKPKEHSFAFKRQQLKRRAMQFLQDYVREKGHSISVVVLNTVTQNEEFLLEFCDFQDGIMKKSQFYQRVQDYVELADIKMSLSKKGKKFSSLARDADVEDIPEKTFGQPPMQIPGQKKPDNADSDSESETEIDSLRRQKQQLFQKRSNMIKELSRLRDRLDRSLDGEEKAELGTQILEKETDLQNVKAEITKIGEAMQEKER